MYLDGICLKRSQGYREVLGVTEGAKEDKAGWSNFLRHLKERGLTGVKLFISDRCLGLVESLSDFYPKTDHQRCTVHFYRNVFPVVPRNRMKEVSNMLKAIHVQEDRAAALEKIDAVAAKLLVMKLSKASEKVKNKAHETLPYYAFPTNPQVQQQQT